MSVRTMGRAAAMIAALAFTASGAVFVAPSASALDQPKTPQPVVDYFAEGLIPRLIDLYGAGDGVTKGTDFDATTQVGAVLRVREWTPHFLAGKAIDDPTRLTNNWVASVSVRGDVIGLATVWINPGDNEPELATFDSADFARKLAAAPKNSWLIHDPARGAWFALTEDGLVPLVAGTSGVTEPLTVAAYQRIIVAGLPEHVAEATSGVPMAALVLGVVVLLVAIFVVLPVRRKGTSGFSEDEPDADADADDELDHPEEPAEPAKPPKPAVKTATVTTSAARKPAMRKPAVKMPAAPKPEAQKPAVKKPAAASRPTVKTDDEASDASNNAKK